jgi:hypothetical protein
MLRIGSKRRVRWRWDKKIRVKSSHARGPYQHDLLAWQTFHVSLLPLPFHFVLRRLSPWEPRPATIALEQRHVQARGAFRGLLDTFENTLYVGVIALIVNRHLK